jgi:hypothetical protein
MKRKLLFLLFLAGFTGYSQAPDLTMCDQNHDDTEVFDISGQTAILLMSQPAGNYTVSYHASLADAENNTSPLPSLVLVHGLQMVVYARVENSDTHNFGIDSFSLNIALVPNPQMPQQATICMPSGTLTLDSNLPPNPNFIFTWSYNNQVLPGSNSNIFEATFPGTYTVSVSYGAGFCSESASTVVVASATPSNVSATVSGQTITVNATGIGLYEYSIDNGSFQSYPIFENVPVGNHTIIVRDQNGCGAVSFSTSVLGLEKNNFTSFSCAPNPVHDMVKIANSQPIDKITVTNALGQIVLEKSGRDTHTTIDFSNRNSGLYILKVESGNQQKMVKILKE